MENTNTGYYVYDWMCTKLKLKGTTLLIYAIIYSFSENSEGCYASIRTLSKRLNVSTKVVWESIKELKLKEFIKIAEITQYQTFRFYTTPIEEITDEMINRKYIRRRQSQLNKKTEVQCTTPTDVQCTTPKSTMYNTTDVQCTNNIKEIQTNIQKIDNKISNYSDESLASSPVKIIDSFNECISMLIYWYHRNSEEIGSEYPPHVFWNKQRENNFCDKNGNRLNYQHLVNIYIDWSKSDSCVYTANNYYHDFDYDIKKFNDYVFKPDLFNSEFRIKGSDFY